MIIEWYTTLLTFYQATAVWLVSVAVLSLVASIIYYSVTKDYDPGAAFAFYMLSLFVYPALYWAVWLVLAFIDLIVWLWAH